MQVDLRVGDCLQVLKDLPDESVDSCVTDPPYGLGKPPPIEDVLRAWLAGEPYTPKSKAGGFMGKKWDAFVPGPEVWREVFRVLKPGGHLLAFFGTRTYDVGALAIRLAGFEIRDEIAWLYGTGFPKSSNVSKSIDKAAGAEREVLGRNPNCWDPKDNRVLGGGKGIQATGIDKSITAPATPEAEQWDGWGSSLKPCHEPVCVARKPFKGPLFRQVLATGTGALNIDACRIGYRDDEDKTSIAEQPPGRWPANVAMDEVAAAMLDAQAGERKSGGGLRQPSASRSEVYDINHRPGAYTRAASSGGASRFFYCAKASKRERSAGVTEGNKHPTVKPIALMRWLVRMVTPPGGVVLDPFAGSGSTLVAALEEGFQPIGVELSPEYAEIARQRCAAAAHIETPL